MRRLPSTNQSVAKSAQPFKDHARPPRRRWNPTTPICKFARNLLESLRFKLSHRTGSGPCSQALGCDYYSLQVAVGIFPNLHESLVFDAGSLTCALSLIRLREMIVSERIAWIDA